MTVQLEHIFTGEGMWRREVNHQSLINDRTIDGKPVGADDTPWWWQFSRQLLGKVS